jgi:hypothetical protein
MPPSRKLAAPWSAAFTAALTLGLSALLVLKDPLWATALAETAERVSGIWFKPGADVRQAAEKAAREKAAAADATAAPDAEDGESREAAFLVPPLTWSHLQIEAALMQCLGELGPMSAEVVPLAPHAYGGCGTPAPVLLRSLGANQKVAFDPPLLVNCPIVAALHQWLEDKVQPAARAAFGSPVTRIVASSYACRTPYNLPSDRLSQHAFANAIDLPVFVLADGRTITVTSGWGPTRRDLDKTSKPKLVPVVVKQDAAAEDPNAQTGKNDLKTPASGSKDAGIVVKASATEGLDAAKPDSSPAPAPDPLSKPEAKFLRQVHRGACESFSTVLGPESNDVHRTHLHLDLQERNGLNVCR